MRTDRPNVPRGRRAGAHPLRPLLRLEPRALLNDYLEPAELAAALGVSARTLARWAALGLGPPRTALGRRVLYRRAAIAAGLAAREAAPARGRGGR